MIELNHFYPGDIGVLSPLYLHPVQLNPGEAVYVPAGELHVYLGGLGIELMANSDNVLRGGLTSKHIDIDELLNVVNFQVESVKKIEPIKKGICEEVYPAPAEEFLLSVITLHQGTSFISSTNRSVEILICIEGTAHIRDFETGEVLPLSKGISILVPAGVTQYCITGEVVLYKASVPL